MRPVMLPRATSKLQWFTALRPPKSFTKLWMLSSGGPDGNSAAPPVPSGERGGEPGTVGLSDTSSNLALCAGCALCDGIVPGMMKSMNRALSQPVQALAAAPSQHGLHRHDLDPGPTLRLAGPQFHGVQPEPPRGAERIRAALP